MQGLTPTTLEGVLYIRSISKDAGKNRGRQVVILRKLPSFIHQIKPKPEHCCCIGNVTTQYSGINRAQKLSCATWRINSFHRKYGYRFNVTRLLVFCR